MLPDVDNALRAVKRGTTIELSVGDIEAPRGGGFNVHESFDPSVPGERLGELPTTNAPSYEQSGVLGDGLTHFYQMHALNTCGIETP